MAAPFNKLAGWLSKALASSAGGAAIGAGVGALTNEDPVEGAKLGAVTGAVAGPLSLAGERLVNRVVLPTGEFILGNEMNPGAIRRRALDEMLNVMKLDETDPSALRHQLDQYPGQDLTLADVGGENMLMRADNAAQIPGPARNQARAMVKNRFSAQPDFVTRLTQQYLTPSLNARMAIKDIQNLKSQEAQKLYGEVFSAFPVVQSPEINRLMPRLDAAGAIDSARKLAHVSGQDLPMPSVASLPDGSKTKVYSDLSLEQLDKIKQGLDDKIAEAKRAGSTQLMAKLVQLKHEMLGVLDTIAPAYADARASFAGYSSSQNALEEGQSFDKGRIDDVLGYFNSLEPGDQEFFRMGVGQRIKDLVNSGPEGQDAVRKFFRNKETRAKLQSIFPDAQSFEKYSAALEMELNKARVNNAIAGGSPTYKRSAEGAARLASDPVVSATLTPGAGLSTRALNIAMSMLGHDPEKINSLTGAEITKMMLNPNLHINQQTLLALQNRERMNRIKKIISAGMQAGAVGAGAAGAANYMTQDLGKPEGMAEGAADYMTQDLSKPEGMAEGGHVASEQMKRPYVVRMHDENSPWKNVLIGETYVDPNNGNSTQTGITDFMIPFSDELDAWLGTVGKLGLGPPNPRPWGRGISNPRSPEIQDWNRRYDSEYSDRLGLERAASDQYAEHHPGVALVGGALSYLPMLAMGPEGLAGGMARIAPRMTRAAGQLGNRALSYALEIAPETSAKLLGALNRAASSVVSTSPAAAVYGFDQGEGSLENRLQAAKESLIYNAPISALFPWLGPLSRAAKALMSRELASTTGSEASQHGLR
jgi:hypothetical protein